MSEQIFYAHTDPKNPGKTPEQGANWQELKDHLRGVADFAKKFAKEAKPNDECFANSAYLTGLLHDLGKYRIEFQKYLKKEQTSGIDTHHAVYGAASACHCFNTSTISFAIAGHHTGIHNASDLSEMIEGNKYSAINRYPKLNKLLEKELGKIATSKLNRDNSDNMLHLEFMARMLFSMLIDADRLNSEEWEKSMTLGKPWKRRIYAFHADCLLDRLITARDEKSRLKVQDELNNLRNTVFEECLFAGQKEQGLFSLTVPTGGGKTLSSMAFALSHAKNHNLRRVIVVIPYLSIIEQNAKEYRDIFGEGQVLEHHCAVEIPYKSEQNWNSEPAEASFLEKAMENWDMPIIVTTSVQFIETLFSNKPGKARKLHNVARSVVIFDEVQTMPVHLLNPVLDIIRTLKDEYKVSFLFCSATQPAFRKSANVSYGFTPEEVQEIVPDPKNIYKKLNRVNYQIGSYTDKWNWLKLADNMLNKPQSLAVVNLRKHAFDVWRELKNSIDKQGLDSEGLFHLSSAMCPAHRLDILGLSKTPASNNIKKRLSEKRPCWVISTQLIEAGVDIDFPVVFRAIGPLDSIVQSAGRCNREGLLQDEKGNPVKGQVAVFYPEDDGIPQGIYLTATNITPSYLIAPGDISLCPEIFGNYFTELYQLKPTDHNKKGEHSIQEDRQMLNFKNVGEHGKVIEDNTISVVVPYGRANEIVASIRKSKKFDKDILRQLQRYMVNVRYYQHYQANKPSDYEKLKNAGALEPLLPEVIEIPVLKPQNGCSYSTDYGLVINDISPEDLIA